MQTIGSKIKQLRKEAGLTQAELAKEIGIKQCSICFWEKGTCIPNIYSLIDIANFFGLATIDELVGRKGYTSEKKQTHS